jgi:hypothetical protein
MTSGAWRARARHLREFTEDEMTTRSASQEQAATETRAAGKSTTDDDHDNNRTSARERASDMAVGVMSGMRDAAGTVAERLPEAAAATKATVDEATRRMEGGSDQTLMVGAAMSFGFAAGLLVGGAPRLLVTAALVPAVAMGMTLIDRSGRTARDTATRPQ